MEYRNVSLASQVYERLESDILSCKYQYGEIITELGLCADLGVSRTPVREALRRLEQENLVEDCGKGKIVRGITRKDFEDMCEVRLRIESLAVRGFAEHADENAMNNLREVLEFQEFYLQRDNRDQIHIMDGRFHQVIYQYCGSAVLRDILSPMHKKIQNFRRISIKRTGRAGASVEEHRQIYAAVEARNAELAENLMKEHIYHAMKSVMDREDTPWA